MVSCFKCCCSLPVILIIILLYRDVDGAPRRRKTVVWTDIEDIIVSKGDLTPSFNKSIYHYSLDLWSSVESILMSIKLNTTAYGINTDFITPSIYIQGNKIDDYTPLQPIEYIVLLNYTVDAINMDVSVLLIDPVNDGWLIKARSEYIIKIRRPPDLKRLLPIKGLSVYDDRGTLIPLQGNVSEYIIAPKTPYSTLYIYPQCDEHATGFVVGGQELPLGAAYTGGQQQCSDVKEGERMLISCYYRDKKYTNGNMWESIPVMVTIYKTYTMVNDRDIIITLQDEEGGECSSRHPTSNLPVNGSFYCKALRDVIHFTLITRLTEGLIGRILYDNKERDGIDIISDVPTEAIKLPYSLSATFTLHLPYGSVMEPPSYKIWSIIVYRNSTLISSNTTTTTEVLPHKPTTTPYTTEGLYTTTTTATTTTTTPTSTIRYTTDKVVVITEGPVDYKDKLWYNYPMEDIRFNISCVDEDTCRCILMQQYFHICVILDEITTLRLLVSMESALHTTKEDRIELIEDGKVVSTIILDEVSDDITVPDDALYTYMLLRYECHHHHNSILDIISSKPHPSSSSSTLYDYPIMIVHASHWSHALHAYKRIVLPQAPYTFPTTQYPPYILINPSDQEQQQ